MSSRCKHLEPSKKSVKPKIERGKLSREIENFTTEILLEEVEIVARVRKSIKWSRGESILKRTDMDTRIVIMEDTTLDTQMSMTNEAIDSIQDTKENTKLKHIDN